MRLNRTLSLVGVLCLLLPVCANAQDEARAAWQVTNFDITVNSLGLNRALNATAIVTARNIGKGAGSTLSLRINSKAEIKSVRIGNASATFESRAETRGNALRFTINLPASVAPNDLQTVTVEYSLPVPENSGLNAISPVSSQFLPQSMWYPVSNNSFAVRGADCAPFHLTVSGANALSSGVEKSANGNSVFEQNLNGQPFFVDGNRDRVDGSQNARDISAYLWKGAGPDEQKQAEALINLANDARSFYSALLGAAPAVPLRLIEVTRGGGFDDAGVILLGEGAFHRRKIDATTALTIGEAMARLWIGGLAPVRGEGNAVVREGLVRFLATLFIEKQFGPSAAESERERQRIAYASVAKRDSPLSRSTPGDNTYFNTVSNKGAMVWRLIDHLVGHDAFVAVLQSSLAAKNDPDGLSLNQLRMALANRGGSSLKGLMDHEFDQATDLDLMVGLPHQEGGQWLAALRNLGSIETAVDVAATTDTGQRLEAQSTIPAHDFGQASFKTAGKIVRVEVDPEKYYPQIDFSNDIAPRQPEVAASISEATRLFGAQEYAKAEALARDVLNLFPETQEARIVLARTLLAENKIEEAEKEFKQLSAASLPIPAALAWSSIGMGEIALRRGQTADAIRDFTDAVRADAEYASTVTARADRIRAESTAGSSSPVDESAKAFVNQLDAAIRSGRQAEVAPLIVPGELSGFIRGAVSTQPEAWQTKVLRSEQLDANRLAVDVSITSRQLGADHSGTAVFMLARVAGSWKLNAIEFFEVK